MKVRLKSWLYSNHIYEKSAYEVYLEINVDQLIKILMRTSLRPERKQECCSLLILTREE